MSFYVAGVKYYWVGVELPFIGPLQKMIVIIIVYSYCTMTVCLITVQCREQNLYIKIIYCNCCVYIYIDVICVYFNLAQYIKI
ncbi:hypothetical protein GDO86_019356 [Hymenochirus boettgeri]|uniref:Uncharacterized protein n=1 Tax=Hymenochirus boettgeri TaxID=247094 RepID=A0A8T2IEV7_9PIPI|nr:hypothetical protein GDO86_019356 [Hymenochirus boettgeri]